MQAIPKSQYFAWPVVEMINRVPHLFGAYVGKRFATREVLAQQPNTVLIHSTLPGAVGVRKIYPGLECTSDDFMPRKLLAAAESNCGAAVLKGQQHTRERCGHLGGFPVANELRHYTPRLALRHNDQGRPHFCHRSDYRPPSNPAVTCAQH